MGSPGGEHAARLGGIIFVGAALLAAGAVGLQWPLAPPVLHNPLVQVVLAGAGALVLFTALATLILDRRARASRRPASAESPAPELEPSLIALPSMLAPDSAASPDLPSSQALTPIPQYWPSVAGTSAGHATVDPGNSTLLIPFAENPPTVDSAPEVPPSGATVAQLVDRMGALQRSTAARPPVVDLLGPSSESAAPGLSLEHRLSRVPSPPTSLSMPSIGRRCSDCGNSLGLPPQFEACMDCGRALCERCFWRTSSGPQAHLCSTCFRDRSVPRPPAPTTILGRPRAIPSVSTSSRRLIPPRRPVS